MAGNETPERMTQVSFHFHAELNDFLPAQRKDLRFAYTFKHRASIKDMIEALGVPHTEVDLILVNGTPVDFGYLVRDGDDIAVYPHSKPAIWPAALHVGPPPLAEARFVLDSHLGKLAAYLRLLGFDTLYRNNFDDETLARISSDEQRILLTRDRNLLKRGIVTHGYYVRETAPRRQVVEVLRRFELLGSIAAYQRCIRCNGLLQPVHKEMIADQLAPKTRQFYDEFHVCRSCGQIYWKGSHYEPLQQFIEDVLGAESSR
jgi:uncharacterized protein